MRPCSWAAVRCPLLVLVPLTLLSFITASENKPRTRHYYIAAVPIDWDYSEGHGHGRPGPSYKKVVFREYEEGFRQTKTHPSWLGLLGPTLRGQVGDTIVVTFKNMADRVLSVHPHGIAYGKQSEGALYFDNTSRQEKEDDVVPPNGEHTYYWELNSKVAPQKADPPCITYTYQSHYDVVKDYNSGLIGTLLVCKPGSLDEAGQQVQFHHEYVLMFGVFDESHSWYKPTGSAADSPVKYTINGYTHGAVPGLSVCAHTPVSLHLVGMGSEPEAFSVHMNGQMLEHLAHRVASVGLISGTATSVKMSAVYPGRWLLSSQTNKHLEAGMHGFVDVISCEGIDAPRRRLTIQQSNEVKEWTFFIAAEEVVWDYAPNMPEIDGDFKLKYLSQGPQRIGKRYKKVVYTQYTDATFTRKEPQRKMEVGMIGPVIRAQIRDVIKIVFKNKASRPYSIYPHGLTIDKQAEGANYPVGGNQTHGVKPGANQTYVWRVIEEDEPFDTDSRCLTRMYHSAVNTPRDIASGLIGPLLICKSQSLNVKNVQRKADKEQHAMFAIFDENKSWYLDDNIQSYSEADKVRKDDPDFYQSNVMHTVNGYVFDSGEVLGFCNADIVTWHVSSVGAHSHIQTVTFYGHVFNLNGRTEDFLSLFPMSGETITVNMDNVGVWLMASLNSHETTKGMRVKFRDAECFSHYEYEYSDNAVVWRPEDINEVKAEQENPPTVVAKAREESIDEYTDMYAAQFDIRSLKQNGESDMETLDLSFLDDDVVDVSDGKTYNSTIHTSVALPGSMPPSPANDSSVTLPASIPPSPANDSSVTLPASIPPSPANDSSVTLPASIPPSPANDSSVTLPASIPPSPANDSSVTLPASIAPSPANDSSVTLPASIPPSPANDSSVTLPASIPPSPANDSSVNLPDSIPPSPANDSSVTLPASIPPSPANDSSVTLPASIPPSPANDSSVTLPASIPPSPANDSSVTLPASIPPSPANDSSVTLPASIPPSPPNRTYNSEMEKVRNSTIPQPGPSPDSLNHTLLAKRNMIDIHNLTSRVSSHKGINENRSETLDQSAGQSSSSVAETGNRTAQNISSLRSEGTMNTGASKNMSSETRAQTRRDQSLINFTLDTDTSEDKVTRGDVFSHAGFPEEVSNEMFVNNASLARVSPNENSIASTGNTTGQLDLLKNATNQSEPVVSTAVRELNLSRLVERNMSSFNQEIEGMNLTNGNNLLDKMTTEEYGDSLVLPEAFFIADNSSLKHETNNRTSPHTVPKQNVITNASIWNQQTLSEQDSSSTESVSNQTTSPTDDPSLPVNQKHNASSEDVTIYLKDSDRDAIRTTSLNSEDQHWGYDATHHTVTMEMPDHLIKYVGNAQPEKPAEPSPAPTPGPTQKPKVKVLRRHWPQKGRAIRTRKKKTYKPQPKKPQPMEPNSGFSPRGSNPLFSPRGMQPITKTEEDLMNKAIVIGVPRADFSDYDLYVPGDHDKAGEEVLAKSATDSSEEYEYISFKDPYSLKDFPDLSLDESAKYFLKTAGKNVRIYYITAEEVEWDYAGYGGRIDRKPDGSQFTKFTKVMFRGYVDQTFQIPDIRGETEEHLGILGPLIKAEVGETIMVLFRNLAKRSYSLHPNGVTYTKYTEGLSYADESDYWFKYDNEVKPNTTFTYIWNVHSYSGPLKDESDCRTWAYYSGVNPEKDIHSGLIGPLLVCRPGTLDKKEVDMHVFTLLFMTFDESQSWYYDRNRERIERKNKRALVGPNFKENLRFHAINGIIFGLKGLRMYSDQRVRWHLINMGPPQDLHSVHFHGQTFLQQSQYSYRQGVYPLLPGGLATLEMSPSRPGLWQLETEVGLYQQKGMQTLILILDKNCSHPLGLESRSVTDRQITASSRRGSWEPSLARLHNQGKYNGWSTDRDGSWIQVDFQRPVVISQVATQGAKQNLWSHYVVSYAISYSTDRRKWSYYKGDNNKDRMMTFTGNNEADKVQTNTFFPPLIGRYVRLHPLSYHNTPMVRMEFYGCQLDGCSVPLGMESRQIEDYRITSSSMASSWYSGKWLPSLARLNNQGTINAWQANSNNAAQWLQVELSEVKKITGIVTQGARALGKEKFVTSYALQYSDDGALWRAYTDDDDYVSKAFPGNTDNNGHVKNYIYPPIFSRFIRIIPLAWHSSITMRIELLGCDFE